MQKLLPIHVVNEYCHPSRSFDPCPEFKESNLPRGYNVGYKKEEQWFSARYRARGDLPYVSNLYVGEYHPQYASVAVTRDSARMDIDLIAIQKLKFVRMTQLTNLKSELQKLDALDLEAYVRSQEEKEREVRKPKRDEVKKEQEDGTQRLRTSLRGLIERKEREEKARTAQAKGNEKVEEFLKYVVEGEQDKAEELLNENKELALKKGTVTDLSRRTFANITGFQYALWALGWHMWKMIYPKYLPREEAAEQFAELEEKGIGVHGKHFSLEPLIKALDTFVTHDYSTSENDYSTFSKENLELDRESAQNHIKKYWIDGVGSLQLLLPVHVVNEYCRPDRGFFPCPTFDEEALPRRLYYDHPDFSWFKLELGEKWAVFRYNCRLEHRLGYVEFQLSEEEAITADIKALRALWKMRQTQIHSLRSDLSIQKERNQCLLM